ncbi:hypothetical protein [Amycolatopsis suaedae]|uniref:Uncharacterized protein n=1 Tax=Amycolatopsis suaedae TaxID=2510978 RepID=A0A4Q7J9H3_9PSEU|nr:hypothetical protein [Amycolatopsis suaedae]RZQ64411.1 hypothetical protein EWH70_10650 [Amycolatopsis suaedae]
MPDWTYHPLRGIAAALLGVRRSQRLALRTLAAVGSLPGGGHLVAAAFGHRHPPAHLAGTVDGVPVCSRLGAVVPPSVAVDAVRALPPLGAGVVAVAPVGPGDVATVRRAARRSRVPLLAHVDCPETAAAVAPHVDAVRTGAAGGYLTSPDVGAAASALAAPDAVVLASPSVLVEAGPGWFARVAEAATAPAEAAPARIGPDPRRWPAWWWGTLLGAGMVVAGLCAVVITLGPVLLWYDRAHLGTDVAGLHAINHHLVHFLQHDRITMAGTMVAIGIVYIGLSAGGMRRGRRWARDALLISGCVGFPTLFYFLGTGFVEPLHTAATIALLPLFVLAVARRTGPPRARAPNVAERVRRRALTGQLLMVVTGAGLLVGGAVVSFVGLTTVFVDADLEFLGTTADALAAADPELVPFIAHDRAGFGGALLSAAVAITLLSAWGWRPGEAWVWWTLLGAAVAGFAPAVVVHGLIHYTDFGHLAPVFAGMALTAAALLLGRPYLRLR